MAVPTLLALDFDGVLCDGLREYFQTAWRAYQDLQGLAPSAPGEGLAEQFYPLRPVVETGWEMPLLIYALNQGVEPGAILGDWPALIPGLLAQAGWEPPQIMAAVDGVRDGWITTDLPGWLALQGFYPGVLDWLHQAQACGCYPVIISTKEGRFIDALLRQQGVTLAPEQIRGKEVKQPKAKTLTQLLQSPPPAPGESPTLWFIEDRYPTLTQVMAYPDLDPYRGQISLFLADWGYNTDRDRTAAQTTPPIQVISLTTLPTPQP